MMLPLCRVGKRAYGFTLIELMIVVCIIAILAAIAFPAYDAYVIRGKRAEGRALLMDAASKMEKHYSDCLKFSANISTVKNCSSGAAGAVNICGSGTCNSETGKYNLTITSTDANSYTLFAAPTFTDAQCGTFALRHTGEKCINSTTCSSADATAVRDCWGR